MSKSYQEWLEKKLEAQKEKKRWRSLQTHNSPVDFCSNDYLGLSQHPLLKARSIAFMERWGCGARASRLTSGTFACHLSLEEKIASFKEKPAALLFNSGFQGNLAALSALVDRETLVFADRLCHYSLFKGVELGRGRLIRFKHNDPVDLERLLEAKGAIGKKSLILTESLFGMDGDTACLDRLIELKERFGSLLYVDEAHATGIIGDKGKGLALSSSVDFVLGTCGKALGSFGAFLACSKRWKEFLVNYSGGFMFTTALPPQVLGSIDAALDLVPGFEKERSELFKRAASLKRRLEQSGFQMGESTTHILPLLLTSEEKALNLSLKLEQEGLYVPAIRAPTVPQDRPRLRIALTIKHSEEEVERLIEVLETYAGA